MKLFQHLLVAPAALGLLAPIAAQASDLNVDGMSDYSATSEQVTSATQFSDVYPTDWSYQALANLTERYGCLEGYPDGTFGGNKSMTRFEAAGLLNVCLDRVTEVSDDVKRLLKEFSSELASIKGKIGGSESLVGQMAAQQFSPTTKLRGEANFYLGARVYDEECSGGCSDAMHMQYTTHLSSITSFNGNDALKIDLEAGNANNASDIVADTAVDTANDELSVKRIYYTAPIGEFNVAIGPLFDMAAVTATTTSSYSNEGLFYGWYYGPNMWSNHRAEGAPGASLAYIGDSGFNASFTLYSAGGASSSQGIGTDEGYDITRTSVGYDGPNYGGGVIYTQHENPEDILGYSKIGTANYGNPTVWGFGAYWNATDSFDISFGYDLFDVAYTDALGQEYDVLQKWVLAGDLDLGNGVLSAAVTNIPDFDTLGAQEDAGMAYELYYTYNLTDYITIKPMIMIHELGSSGSTNWIDDQTYALESTFKF